MPALSTGTYGKASPMAVLTDFADRLTAILASAHAAIGDLNTGVMTGAPVSQASVNTLTKVLADLGEIATSARKDAADETEQAAKDTSGSQAAAAGQTSPAKPATGTGTSTGTASTSGSTAAKS